MTRSVRTIYDIGIKIESKEAYDRLMKEHSKEGFFGLDFKRLFDGYPEDYPTLVQYMVDTQPFGMLFATQLQDIVDAGYKVIIEKE